MAITLTAEQKTLFANTLLKDKAETASQLRVLRKRYFELRDGGFFVTASQLDIIISKFEKEIRDRERARTALRANR